MKAILGPPTHNFYVEVAKEILRNSRVRSSTNLTEEGLAERLSGIDKNGEFSDIETGLALHDLAGDIAYYEITLRSKDGFEVFVRRYRDKASEITLYNPLKEILDNSYFSAQNTDLVGGMIDALSDYISNNYPKARDIHDPKALLTAAIHHLG